MIDDAEDVDVAIIGAGPLGMALALALADLPRIVLIDSRPRGAWIDDPRALALAHGSRQLLARLNAWNADAATPISEIHVSQRGGFGRTLIAAADYHIPALGYVMRYRDLAAALDSQIRAEQLRADCTVEKIEAGSADTHALLTVRHNGARLRLRAKLIVHADGVISEGDGGVKVRDYHQHAIIAEVRPTTRHINRAWERFTADGPLALLPLGEAYAAVFTVPHARAAQLLSLDDDDFLAALRDQFGKRVDFVASGARSGFPLLLRVRAKVTQQRQVWIGNSAQTLHPVSGQGFNLGLRDAWQLAAVLPDYADAGDPTALAAYARGRQVDRKSSVAFTDGLVHLFSNDLPPLRLARGLGLLALDLFPPLRHVIARRMIWGARAWP